MDEEGGGTEAAVIWIHTIQTLGQQLVTDGFLTRLELDSAEARYHDFIRTLLTRQTLNMKTVVGRRILGKRS